MHRRRQTGFEPLESRSLLSGMSSLPMIPAPMSPSDVAVTLTTDRPVYAQGEPVKMTLTETNVTSHEIAVPVGPSIDGFFVTHDGATIWSSNRGPVPLYIMLRPLAPGASFSLTATWNGAPNEGRPTTSTGLFQVHSQVPGASPVTIQIGPTDTASSLQLAVTTDKSAYKVGAPVTITIIETNTGSQAASVGNLMPGSVTIARRGTDVWSSPAVDPRPGYSNVLQPGQARQFQLVWSGTFAEHVRQPRTGPFHVSAALDGLSGSSGFSIRR